ncbi:12838_t:CDS:2 [Gigaspora rosea]|nr:12838_t:CDS:2 [Gigaspora rosea]
MASSMKAIQIKSSFFSPFYWYLLKLFTLSLPAVLGQEGAGVIETVGEGVKDIQPGDHVAYINASSYAEFTIASSKNVAKVPDGLDLKLTAASLLQSYEVKKVIVFLSMQPQKAKLVISVGVHAVFDGVGKDTFETSLACARRLGSSIVLGNASGTIPPFDILKLSEKNLKLMRTSLTKYIETEEKFKKCTAELFAVIKERKLDIKIWKTYQLSDARQAHLDLEGKKTSGKLILQL